MFNKLRKYLIKEKPPEVEVKEYPQPRLAPIEKDPALVFEEMIARNFQRSATQDMIQAPVGRAMDDNLTSGLFGPGYQNTVPNSLICWFGTQTFIGYQTCAILAQHWLILKCLEMPARDAIRHGYEITGNDGVEIEPEILEAISQADIRYGMNKVLKQFVTKGRMFGFRIALFLVDTEDGDAYYEKPFNIDAVLPGSYKGIVQIDPYWITPELDFESGANPASRYFYEPTWWRVNARRIHRTHLHIFRNGELADLLKPTYLYGGIPVPQQIYERVYCAERTANEAPQLAMTKRIGVIFCDAARFLANQGQATQSIQQFTTMMNNYGQKILDINDRYEQHDVSLSHFTEVIHGQYELVAAAAGVPYTKLMGTVPKGMNATGEYDEASYHEYLESIQTNDLTVVLERHHALLIRSEISPEYNVPVFKTKIEWNSLDARTAEEQAALNKMKAETDEKNIMIGAISPNEARNRLINDPESGYNGLAEDEAPGGEGGDPEEESTDPELEEGLQSGEDPDEELKS